VAVNGLELEIQGDVRKQTDALQKVFLETLGWKGIRKLEQFATVNAARAFAPYVRAAAPTDSKQLAKSVRGRKSKITKPGAVVGPVGGRKGAYYAWMVVKGTSAHRIPKLTGGQRAGAAANAALDRLGAGHSIFGPTPGFLHPGVRGDNFVIETVAAKIQVGKDAMAATIVLLLNDTAKRNQVLGLEASYKNKTAARWQSEPWGRYWKDADYLETVFGSNQKGTRRRETVVTKGTVDGALMKRTIMGIKAAR
jgi:hypothetical protein